MALSCLSDIHYNVCLVLVIWNYLLTHSLAAMNVNKVRLCLEYVSEDYWAGDDALLAKPGMTQGTCMALCARKPPCMAFNFRPMDGNCRLHTPVTTCVKPNTTKGWIYVSLSTCDQRRPWRSLRPAENGWQWIAADERNAGSNVVAYGARFASRVFYRGLYLPGWWANFVEAGVFRAVKPNGGVLRCKIGQLLVVSNPGRVRWSSVTTNHTVLENGVIGGYGPDSTPLYVSKRQFGSQMLFGFYNACNEIVYFFLNGREKKLVSGEILRFN